MESFKYKDKEIKFWRVTGEVIGQNKYSETHISSSGGGGVVTNRGGYVGAPQVHSRAITNHEFWIKKDDGSEMSVQLSDVDIPLREGHKISLIGSRPSDKKVKGQWAVLVNHSEGKHRFINKGADLNMSFKIAGVTGLSVLISAVIWFVIIFAVKLNGGGEPKAFMWATGITLVYFISNAIYKLSRINDMTAALDKHLESLSQETYKQVA
jgi:hypothetical protein